MPAGAKLSAASVPASASPASLAPRVSYPPNPPRTATPAVGGHQHCTEGVAEVEHMPAAACVVVFMKVIANASSTVTVAQSLTRSS